MKTFADTQIEIPNDRPFEVKDQFALDHYGARIPGETIAAYYERLHEAGKVVLLSHAQASMADMYRSARKVAEESGRLFVVLDDPAPVPGECQTIAREDAQDMRLYRIAKEAAENKGLPLVIV